jgi:hypothetical protein
MVSDHRFRVETRQNRAAAGRVSVSVPFPGPAASLSLPAPSGDSTLQFEFDLQALGVPRFTRTLKLPVSASFPDQPTISQSRSAVIPLPVVTVHGINGGSGRFPELEKSLAAQSAAEWGEGNGYGLSEALGKRPPADYPTLFAFRWASNTATLNAGAGKLKTFLEGTVRGKTWADRAVLIGYSRGANLTRLFINKHGAAYTAGAVLACMPAAGSLSAYYFRGKARADLMPTYPWRRDRSSQPFRVSPRNPALDALNRSARPQDVELETLYGYTAPANTPNTLTTKTGRYTYVQGDGVVTAFSAQGIEVTPDRKKPNVLVGQRQVAWMDGVPVQGFLFNEEFPFANPLHVQFLKQPEVLEHLFTWLDTHAVEEVK